MIPLHLPPHLQLHCHACQYDLRGLQVGGKCPECGEEIVASLEAACSIDPELREEIRRHQVEPIARASGYKIDAVLFVYDAIIARFVRLRWFGIESQHIDARSTCDAVREHAVSYFNNVREAKDLLADWKLLSSEDVGKIIFKLVELRWFHSHADDSPQDFTGLFTLEHWFDTTD